MLIVKGMKALDNFLVLRVLVVGDSDLGVVGVIFVYHGHDEGGYQSVFDCFSVDVLCDGFGMRVEYIVNSGDFVHGIGLADIDEGMSSEAF